MVPGNSPDDYALWLKPSGPAYDSIARVIRELAQQLDAPVFEPHVTLLGNLRGTEQEHRRRCQTLASGLQPLEIVLTEPSYRDEYFQCVFMLVQQTPALMSANARAAQTFGQAQDVYLPHVSLLYGRWSEARKREIISRLPRDLRTSFETRSVHLIKACSPDPQSWQEIMAFPIHAGKPDTGGPGST